jgi:hypothetical protein
VTTRVALLAGHRLGTAEGHSGVILPDLPVFSTLASYICEIDIYMDCIFCLVAGARNLPEEACGMSVA